MTSKERLAVKALTGAQRKNCKYIVVINGNKSFYRNARSLIRDMLIDNASVGCC